MRGALYTTAPGYWGERHVTEIWADSSNNYNLEMLKDAEMEDFADEVGRTVDPSKGAVDIIFDRFDGYMPLGGESAELGVGYGYAVIYDASDTAVLDNELVADGVPGVAFWDVNVSEDVMPTVRDAEGQPCLPQPVGVAYPSHAKVITVIYVLCP